MATPYFGIVRQWIMRLDPNGGRATADALEAMLTLATAASDMATGSETDISDLTDRVTTVEADVAAALRAAVQQILFMPLPLTAAEVLALTDTTILTEGGDDIMDENGDALLMESA